jgi:hypothetical protein
LFSERLGAVFAQLDEDEDAGVVQGGFITFLANT